MPRTLITNARIVDPARDRGADVHGDSGMYTAWATYCWSPSFDAEVLAASGLAYEDLVVSTAAAAA